VSHPAHIVAADAVVRDGQGRLLLVRTPARGWEFPGGQVEVGESLTAALEREVLEESGLTVRSGRLLAVYSNVRPPSKVMFTFEAELVGGSLTTSDETPEVGWFKPEEALVLVTAETNRLRLNIALDPPERPAYLVYETAPFGLLNRTSF
jgi:8-oxo-dGTP diphosphatase